MAAYTQYLRCAGAPRRPAGGSGLSLPFLLGMPLSMTPGSSIIASPELRCRHRLRRDLSGSALPILPQSVSRGARLSGLPYIIGYGSSPSRCGPSLSRDADGQTRDLPASDAIPLHVMWPSDPGRATAPRIAVPHMLPSGE